MVEFPRKTRRENEKRRHEKEQDALSRTFSFFVLFVCFVVIDDFLRGLPETQAMRSLILVLLVLAASLEAVAAPRNVVLVVADDQGQDAGCYGNPVLKTPNLDALAADGTRFKYAYCTTASCSPSRSVILTGLFNHANGQYGLEHADHHFRSFDNVQSLPAMLERGRLSHGADGQVSCRAGERVPLRRSAARQHAQPGRDGRTNAAS